MGDSSRQAVTRRHLASAASRAHGYSRAVIVEGGRTIYLCGETALEDARGNPLAGDFEAQAREVFRKMGATLIEAGGGLANLTTMTVFITDPRHGDAFRRVRIESFGDNFPASAMIVVTGFGHPDVLVEVQGIAVL